MIDGMPTTGDPQLTVPRAANVRARGPALIAAGLLGLLLGSPLTSARAQREPVPVPEQAAPSAAAPPAGPTAAPSAADQELARCDSFARLHRYAEQSKALCEEGRQVKPGPVTTGILEHCRALQGARFDRQPVDDMMDTLDRQISEQGIGNACHAASVQAWDLISQ